MARTWKQVNWFRFVVVVGLSFLTSMIFNLDDGRLSIIEATKTLIHALIAGFAYLQCPEYQRAKSEAKQ